MANKALARTISVALTVCMLVTFLPKPFSAALTTDVESLDGDTACVHDIIIDEALPSTCTSTGLTEGSHCTICGEIIVAQQTIDMTEHEFDKGICVLCGEDDPDWIASYWVLEDDKWYLYGDDSNKLTGWQLVKGKWYYLDADSGVMQTGWFRAKGKWYYLDSVNGDMKTGWIKDKGKWYYLDLINGDMKTGWLKDNEKWYYLDPVNGDMKIGWLKVKNKWYFLKTSGAMVTGWLKDKNNWYYLDLVNGDMKTSWVHDSAKWYYMNSSGAMLTGWHKMSGKWFEFNSYGALINGTLVYFGNTYTIEKGRLVYVLISVPYVNQMPSYPTGCEAASASMMLKYYGYDIKLDTMISYIPHKTIYRKNGKDYGPSIYEYFVGNPRNTYVSSSPGYGAFAPVVTSSMNKFIDDHGGKHIAKEITGSSLKTLLSYVEQGKPVIVWSTYNMQTPKTTNNWYIETENGDKYFEYPRGTHVTVLCGYDSNYVYMMDPYKQGLVKFSKSSFVDKYTLLGKQAIVILDK